MTKQELVDEDRIIVRDCKKLNVLYCSYTADEWIDRLKRWKNEYSKYEKYGVVSFEMDCKYSFGEYNCDLYVHFYRRETDKEYKRRVKIREAAKENRRKQYESLKKEFGE